MKVKFKVAREYAVVDYSGNDVGIDEAVELLKRDEVISLSVVKQTPRQYFDAMNKKKKMAKNQEE